MINSRDSVMKVMYILLFFKDTRWRKYPYFLDIKNKGIYLWVVKVWSNDYLHEYHSLIKLLNILSVLIIQDFLFLISKVIILL